MGDMKLSEGLQYLMVIQEVVIVYAEEVHVHNDVVGDHDELEDTESVMRL